MTTTTTISSSNRSKDVQPIFMHHAEIYTFDESNTKEWIPIQPVAIPISIIYDASHCIYKLIAVAANCKDVVVNCTINAGTVFEKTSKRYAHWIDEKSGVIYGIGFQKETKLEEMLTKINQAKSAIFPNPPPLPQNHQKQQNQKTKSIPSNKTFTTEVVQRIPSEYATTTMTQCSSMATIDDHAAANPLSALEHLRIKPPSSATTAMLLLKPPLTYSSASIIDYSSNKQLLQQITNLKKENCTIKSTLSDSVAKYKSWEHQLDKLRQENADLLSASQRLEKEIGDKKSSNKKMQEKCAKLKDNFELCLGKLNCSKEIEEKYELLMGEKRRLEEICNGYEVTSLNVVNNNETGGMSKSQKMNKEYSDKIEEVNLLLAKELGRHREGQGAVEWIDGGIEKLLGDLGDVRGVLFGAFSNNNSQRRMGK